MCGIGEVGGGMPSPAVDKAGAPAVPASKFDVGSVFGGGASAMAGPAKALNQLSSALEALSQAISGVGAIGGGLGKSLGGSISVDQDSAAKDLQAQLSAGLVSLAN